MKIKDTILKKILNKIVINDAIPVLVGGCVRDYFLNYEVKDYDIEVYGLDTLEHLESILEEFGSVKAVGKSFGILKLITENMEYDFSFPRLENKITVGHKGFDVIVDGSLSFEVATKRRDFTINAIGYDYKNNKYLDPFYGKEDIEKKLLKHIDAETFIEDPLRVYRAVQFSGRFQFTLDNDTLNLCQNIVNMDEFGSLSKERIFEEYKKLFLKSKKPSKGLALLNQLKITNIDQCIIFMIDEIVSHCITNDEKLMLIFSLLKNLFITISNDKKMLRKIEAYDAFKIPKLNELKVDKFETKVGKMIEKLEIFKNMPKPLYMGKDLIKMGYKPSEKFKTILDTLYKMQLDGKIC